MGETLLLRTLAGAKIVLRYMIQFFLEFRPDWDLLVTNPYALAIL